MERLVGYQPFRRAWSFQWSMVFGSLTSPLTRPNRVSGTGNGERSNVPAKTGALDEPVTLSRTGRDGGPRPPRC